MEHHCAAAKQMEGTRPASALPKATKFPMPHRERGRLDATAGCAAGGAGVTVEASPRAHPQTEGICLGGRAVLLLAIASLTRAPRDKGARSIGVFGRGVDACSSSVSPGDSLARRETWSASWPPTEAEAQRRALSGGNAAGCSNIGVRCINTCPAGSSKSIGVQACRGASVPPGRSALSSASCKPARSPASLSLGSAESATSKRRRRTTLAALLTSIAFPRTLR